ncbi:MAG: DUF421 domain-containing protein [Frankia sp.]|nr:DUF421 domain-containing protein [Frankia sp.]
MAAGRGRAALRRERLSLDDLAAAAREQGITTFGEIDLAVLEVDGKISFFRAAGQGGAREPSTPAG